MKANQPATAGPAEATERAEAANAETAKGEAAAQRAKPSATDAATKSTRAGNPDPADETGDLERVGAERASTS
jgi:hypothetical protein